MTVYQGICVLGASLSLAGIVTSCLHDNYDAAIWAANALVWSASAWVTAESNSVLRKALNGRSKP